MPKAPINLRVRRPPRKPILALLIAALFLAPIVQAGEIKVALPSRPGQRGVIDTFMRGPIEYLNTEDLAAAFSIVLIESECSSISGREILKNDGGMDCKAL